MLVLVLSLQSCLTLCDAMDHSLPGSSVQGILQARVLEWVVIPSTRDLPNPGIKPTSPVSPAMADGLFTTEPPGKPYYNIHGPWKYAKMKEARHKKLTYCIIHLYEIIIKGKSIETDSILVTIRSWGEGETGSECLNGLGVFFWDDKKSSN